MRLKITDQNDIKSVCDRYKNGESLGDIAVTFSTSRATITRVLEKNGIPRRPPTTKVSPEVEAQVCDLYRKTRSSDKVAKIVGITQSCVCNILKRHGIKRRDKTNWREDITPEMREEMFRRYQDGEDAYSLGEAFGVASTTVYDWLKRAGIERRTPGEAIRVHSVNESAFDVIDEHAAYWIGMMISDGCILGKKGNVIQLALSQPDIGHIESFRQFLQADYDITIKETEGSFEGGKPLAVLRVSSTRLASRLTEFGVVPRKSKTAKVIGLEHDRHFWRGVIDGDGWFYENKGNPTIGVCGSMPLMEQYLGFVGTFAPNFGGSIYPNGQCWKVVLSHVAFQKAVEKIYGDCTVALTRKMKIAQKWLDNPYISKRPDRSSLTLEAIEKLRRDFGSWDAAAKHLRMKKGTLVTLHQRRKAKAVASQH